MGEGEGSERVLNLDGVLNGGSSMTGELTAMIEPAPEGRLWAFCPETAGAHGHGAQQSTMTLFLGR
jgi:hypothetical protein